MRNSLLIGLLILFSCGSQKSEKQSTTLKNVTIKYAKGFNIDDYGDYQLITLHDAWRGGEISYSYLLYKKSVPAGFDNAIKIKVPIKSIACMSLTHIAFIEALSLENSIVAASGCDYVSNPKIISKINKGEIEEVGSQQSLNYELLIEKSPDIVMTFGIDENSLKYINKFKKMGLKPILNAEYMETHPLGKAEWIKFVAAFYGKIDKADSIFNHIEKQYLGLVEVAKTTKEKPSVFVGMPWNGNWYVAGGESFQAQLFKDSGANYLWGNSDEKSSVIKSKELVYDEAFAADFWLNQNSYESVASIIDYDERLSTFSAVKNGKMYNNNNRINNQGGNDYWESATVNPHVVLKDLIEIFHPTLLDHELYYYKKLE